jgi:hypothetical protein
MGRGCRDCRRCTESALVGCLLLPFRLVWGILMLPFRAVQRKCPVCGHPLSWHQRDATGRFKD